MIESGEHKNQEEVKIDTNIESPIVPVTTKVLNNQDAPNKEVEQKLDLNPKVEGSEVEKNENKNQKIETSVIPNPHSNHNPESPSQNENRSPKIDIVVSHPDAKRKSTELIQPHPVDPHHN